MFPSSIQNGNFKKNFYKFGNLGKLCVRAASGFRVHKAMNDFCALINAGLNKDQFIINSTLIA